MPEPLPPEFDAALRRTAVARGPFGARVLYYPEIGSTNDEAMRAAERGEPEGTIVMAAAQRAGRGRLGRSWFSPSGAGLYVSTIIRRAAMAPWVTLVGGVAVAEGILAATGLPVQIKWPNDVVAVSRGAFRERRKIAGVLAEASSTADGLQHIVLGFGINLRNAAFPPELAGRAGSIEAELGRPADAGEVLAQTLGALHRAAREVLTEGGSAILARWRAMSPSADGAAIEWDTPAGVAAGITAGVDDDGALLARTDGRVQRILSGEVRWK